MERWCPSRAACGLQQGVYSEYGDEGEVFCTVRIGVKRAILEYTSHPPNTSPISSVFFGFTPYTNDLTPSPAAASLVWREQLCLFQLPPQLNEYFVRDS
jgi:hypothetical protein